MTFRGWFSKNINFWTLFWIVWKVYVFKFDFDVDQICLKSFRVDCSQRGRWIMPELRAQAQIRWWQMSVILDEFAKFCSFIIKSMWEALLVAKFVVELEFKYQRSCNHPKIVKLLEKRFYMINRGDVAWISHCIGNVSGNRGPGASYSGGFDWWLTRRAYSSQLLE